MKVGSVLIMELDIIEGNLLETISFFQVQILKPLLQIIMLN